MMTDIVSLLHTNYSMMTIIMIQYNTMVVVPSCPYFPVVIFQLILALLLSLIPIIFLICYPTPTIQSSTMTLLLLTQPSSQQTHALNDTEHCLMHPVAQEFVVQKIKFIIKDVEELTIISNGLHFTAHQLNCLIFDSGLRRKTHLD